MISQLLIFVQMKNDKIFPLLGLDTILSSNDKSINVAGKKVLVCQFGIVTEGMIIEKKI